MIHVSIAHISKRYGKKVALQDINAEIHSGSFFCILGEPGAGKTTLLRVIAGLEVPDEGDVFFDGKNVTLLPAQKRDVAMVFQDFALYPHMTVFENIASPLRSMKLEEGKIRERVRRVTRFLKIEHLLERSPLYISGGERQRVAIARALVKEPKISLFDEPLVNLDFKIREDMRAQFKLMQREFNQTIVFVTPDPVDAMSMADQVLILYEGKVQQLATVWEAYYRPNNMFVATYLGFPPMNILSGELEQEGPHLFFTAAGLRMDITNLPGVQEIGEKKLLIGMRPEHLVLGDRGNAEISWDGEVVLSEIVGSDTIVHLKVGKDLTLRSFVPGIYRVAVGAHVTVNLWRDTIYAFKESGESILFPGRHEALFNTF
ncbi:MAG: ABC transporter ATP-binding protein [Candidatus Caldatribacteriaceae bacterium]